MMRQAAIRMAGFAALLLAVPAAPAAWSADDAVSEKLEEMQAQLERLSRDNEMLRSEVDELRSANDDQWLTERRADEIRSIVHDVLADADTRSQLIGDGLMAGWSNGFFLASADGRFRLNVGGQIQARYMYSFIDRPTPFFPPDAGANASPDRHLHGFEMSRTRLAFSGHAFNPDLQYMVRGEFGRDGGSFDLLDAWVRYHFNNEWSLRVGQFKLPFSREQLVSSARQLAVERSLIDSNMNIGRSSGIELTYADDHLRVALAYSDGAQDQLSAVPTAFGVNPLGGAQGGGFNRSALARSVEYAWTARLEYLVAGSWNQFSDFTSPIGENFGLLLGVAGHYQRSEAGLLGFAPAQQNSNWVGYTVDASLELGGASAFLAFTHHYIEIKNIPGFRSNVNVFGFVAQAGMYVTPKVEPFVRYEFGTWRFNELEVPALDRLLSDLHLISVGVNYYLDGHDAKWTTDIGVGISRVTSAWGNSLDDAITGWRFQGANTRPQVVFRTQFQLLF